MAHGPLRKTQPDVRLELLYRVDAQSRTNHDARRGSQGSRTQPSDVFQSEANTRSARNHRGNNSAADTADRQAISRRPMDQMVDCADATGAGHELIDNRRIAGEVLQNKFYRRLSLYTSGTPGRSSFEDGNRLPLVIRSFGSKAHIDGHS